MKTSFAGLRLSSFAVVVAAFFGASAPSARSGAANQPPNAEDLYGVYSGTPVVIEAVPPDSDPENDPLTVTVTLAQQPAGGTATTSGTQITFTPGPSFNGSEYFGYTLSDGHHPGVTAFVSITSNVPVSTVLATTGPGPLSNVPGETNTTFVSFGPPSIESGNVGSLVMIQPGTDAPLAAIVGGSDNSLNLGNVLVRAGDGAAGLKGAKFTSFGQPVFGNDYFGFFATIAGTGIPSTVAKGTDTGLWGNFPNGLDLVAQEGGHATDEAGADLPGVTFSSFISYVQHDSSFSYGGFGRIGRDVGLIFVAKIKGTGVNAGNNLGVWYQDNRGGNLLLKLAFRTGQVVTMPDKHDQLRIKGLKLFVPAKDIPGARRSYSSGATIMALATFAGGRQALIVKPPNETIFGGNTSAYMAVENTNVGTLSLPTLGRTGDYAMRTKIAIGALQNNKPPGTRVTRNTDTVIIKGNGQFDIGVIAQEGDPFDGVRGSTFKAFSEPAMSDDNVQNVVFTAQIAGRGIDASNNTVLLSRVDQNSSFVLIARTGQHAVGTDTNILWKSFTSFAMPDFDEASFRSSIETGPYFLGTLTGPGVNATNDIGLWGRDPNGDLYLLARTGDPLKVNGVDRTVSLITTLHAVADSAGEGRFVDHDQHIVALITFTDHSTGLVRFTMPPFTK